MITIAFDRSTDHGRRGRGGGRAYVDSLFAFDHALGRDYSGEWVDGSTFEITAIDVTVQLPEAGRTSVTSSRRILNAAATATGVVRQAIISGSFGASSAPRLVEYVASDVMSSGAGPSLGDQLRLVFDSPTDTPPLPWPSLFTFTPPLAADIGGGWVDSSTFRFTVGPSGGGTIDDIEGGVPALLVGMTSVQLKGGVVRSNAARLAELHHGVKTTAEQYAPEVNVTLSGTFGTSEPPRLVTFTAFDPMNADPAFGDGDVLYLGFDIATSEGGELVNKKAVDAVFGFSSPLGTDYSGEWTDCLFPDAPTTDTMYCQAVMVTIVDAELPPEQEDVTTAHPEFGVTLAWAKLPDPNNADQLASYEGVKSASGLSGPSSTAVALGASPLSEDEPMHPTLDLGRERIIFLQRSRQPAGVAPMTSEDEIEARAEAVAAAASAAEGALAAAATVPHVGDPKRCVGACIVGPDDRVMTVAASPVAAPALAPAPFPTRAFPCCGSHASPASTGLRRSSTARQRT